MPLNPINLIVADDHEVFRDGLKLLIDKIEGVRLQAMATNGEELVEKVKQNQPDVVFTDIKMPVMNGVEATRYITTHFPQISIIGLTMFDEEDQIIDMLEAGATGYLIKNASKEEIREAVFAAYNKEHYYCSHTTVKITRMIAKRRFDPDKRQSKVSFSDKELEIIQLICDGLTSKEIAQKIHLSYRTIEGYRTRIQEKMDVSNTASIIVYAIKNQIIKIS